MENIKILSSFASVTQKQSNVLIIGTHNGIFHVDEVVACAILCLLNSNMSIWILRTRDAKMLAQCDICVDVGEGEFDHHQNGFNKTRKNGTKYASSGLIWRRYGNELIKLLLNKYFPKFCHIDTDAIFADFDASVITMVDNEDNGKKAMHCFSFVSSFLPLLYEDPSNFNAPFYKALITTMTVLEETLKASICKEISKPIVQSNWNNPDCFCNGILEIPSQTTVWKEVVINLNASTKITKANFVIFPYPDGGWAAQCVPPSLKEEYSQRIPFPREWAGQTDKLPEISGVSGATRCHNGCFFVRGATKEDVVEMCNIAGSSFVN